MGSVWNAQVMQRWAPMSWPATSWCVQHLCSLNSCKVILLLLSLSALGKSLVWLFLYYGVCAWPGVCNPAVTQPQHCLAPVWHPCGTCCLLQSRFSRAGAAAVGWDVPLLKTCALHTVD